MKKTRKSDEEALMEQYIVTNNDNQLLRGQRKHSLKLGCITLDVIPSSTDDMTNVVKTFTKFAKEMNKLHGSDHLKVPATPDYSTLMDSMVG
jgi:hypothetical protein